MDVQRKPVTISGQELNRILSLPKISLKIGGEIKSGHYDQMTKKFYQVDGNGKLTGKVAVVSKLPPSAIPGVNSAEEADAGIPQTQTSGGIGNIFGKTARGKKDEEDDEPDKKPPNKLKKLMPVIIAAGAVIAAACIAVTVVLPMLRGNNNDTPVDPNLPTGTGQPGIVEVTDYQVVQITRDIVPGQMFTLDDLAEMTVPAATYSQAKSFGSELYPWASVNDLLGYYASEFIPAESYLTQDEISAVPPYELNPWGVTDSNSTLLLVPVGEALRGEPSLNYGNYVDLIVRKVVNNQVAVGPGGGEAPAPVEGVTITGTTSDTTRTDEYTVNDMTVCDLLNAQGESVYNTYCAYIGIPASKRLEYISEAFWTDETLKDRLTPAYILVRVTNAQAQALGDLTAQNTTVDIRLKGSLNVVNNDQYMFAQEAADVRRVISAAVAANEQRAAEEEAARQQALDEAMASAGQEG